MNAPAPPAPPTPAPPHAPGGASTPARPRTLPVQARDWRGLARLGVDALQGAATVAEGLHHTIWSLPGPLGAVPAGRTRGLTGLVYRSVQGGLRMAGAGLDQALALWPATSGNSASGHGPSTPQREAFLAALNGVWGDHLAATANPLAIAMQLRVDGLPWRDALVRPGQPAPRRRVLVLVHGLAMHDGQWLHQGHHHGQAVAEALGYSVLALHYNSGRAVADNGRDFSAQLDKLLADWPVPLEELVLVAHSMGGLVSRSAIAQGTRRPWRRRLRGLVCLGTPHHGAPLERGGRWVDLALGVSPYGAPFARLGRSRSAGITDLRFGNVLPRPSARGEQHQDDRPPVPWPRGVPLFLVGATTAAQAQGLKHQLLGDGLVPLASALGEHRQPALRLRVPDSHRLVLTQANHWDLLSRQEVTAQLLHWLGRGG
ncbi:MAG: lipase family alpha/beta hydrolase [Rubrivivax sp.]|jgi:hypothetical protein